MRCRSRQASVASISSRSRRPARASALAIVAGRRARASRSNGVGPVGQQLEHVAVAEPPHRRRHVGVRRGQRVVRPAARAARRRRTRSWARPIACRMRGQRRDARAAWPRPPAPPRSRSGSGASITRSRPSPCASICFGRAHADQQRDVRVPVLDRQALLPVQPEAARVAVVLHHLLRRQVEPGRAARVRALLAQRAEPVQQRHPLALRLGVRHLPAALHHRPLDREGDALPACVEVGREQERGPRAVGQQAGGALATAPSG